MDVMLTFLDMRCRPVNIGVSGVLGAPLLALAYTGGPCGNRNPGSRFDRDGRFAPRRPDARHELVQRGVVNPQLFRARALVEACALQPRLELR